MHYYLFLMKLKKNIDLRQFQKANFNYLLKFIILRNIIITSQRKFLLCGKIYIFNINF